MVPCLQRELALIPDQGNKWTPTHFHCEIAEVAPSSLVGPDTHTEVGGVRYRFREMIFFKHTLVYPEYLVAYRRT